MTASRRKYTAPLIDQFKLAGSRLGLDLAGLFEEDEDGNDGLGGFVPSMTTKALNKSRGNVLSYRPQQRSSSVTEFSLTPESDTSTTPDLPGGPIQDDTETPTEPTNRFDELTSLAAKYGQSSLFGHQDYLKATEQGFTSDEIQEYLRANPNMLSAGNVPGKVGGLFEEIVRGDVDPNKAITRQQSLNRQAAERSSDDFISSTDYGKTGINPLFGQSKDYFGDEDYFAAIKSGYSDDDVRSYLQGNKGQLRGVNAPGGGGLYDKLFGKPSQPSNSGGGGGGGGGGGPVFTLGEGMSSERLGHADVAKAKATGASDDQIRDFLSRNLDKLAGNNKPGQGGLYDEYFR